MNALQEFEQKNLTIFQQLANVSRNRKALDDREKALKDELMAAMKKHGITSIDNEILKINFIEESESVTLDTKSFLAQEPVKYHKLLDKYNKRTVKKSHLRFTVK